MDRRKFIQTGTLSSWFIVSPHRTLPIQMTVLTLSGRQVKLGKTGLKVSRIAMGTGTKGWNTSPIRPARLITL
ncbi:MAG: hypothetical protein ACLR6J_19185 [Parabacteroides merdae]